MENANQKIQLELSIEETNLILTALGQLPYVRVVSLVDKICKQAEVQTRQESKEN